MMPKTRLILHARERGRWRRAWFIFTTAILINWLYKSSKKLGRKEDSSEASELKQQTSRATDEEEFDISEGHRLLSITMLTAL